MGLADTPQGSDIPRRPLQRGQTAWYHTPRSKQLVVRLQHDAIDSDLVTAVPIAPTDPEVAWPMAVKVNLNHTDVTPGRNAWALPTRLTGYPAEALQPAGLVIPPADLASLEEAILTVLGITTKSDL